MGPKFASTIVSAMSARSVAGLEFASMVVGALSARTAVGLKSASMVVGALRVTFARQRRYADCVPLRRATNPGCARRATSSRGRRLSAGMSIE